MARIITIVASSRAAAQEKLRDADPGDRSNILRRGEFRTFEYRREGALASTDDCADAEFDVMNSYVIIATIGD